MYERLNVDDESVKYFINSNNILCREFIRDNLESVIQIIVPYKLITELLKLAHDITNSGHLGVVKTKDRLLLAGFYWPSVGKDVAYNCKTCDVCQRTNKSCVKYKAQMLKPPVIDQPFYRISIDIVGPIAKPTKKGSVFILTVVDHATSWPEAYPLPDHKASTVAKCMIEYFSRFGLVNECLHDLGSEFTSELFQVFLDYFGIDQLKCTVMHPQTNGIVESFHRCLKDMLKGFVDQYSDDWDEASPFLLFAYHEVPLATYGYSPFELVYGRHVRGLLNTVFDNWWEDEGKKVSKSVASYMQNFRDKVQCSLDIMYNKKKQLKKRLKRVTTSLLEKYVISREILCLFYNL